MQQQTEVIGNPLLQLHADNQGLECSERKCHDLHVVYETVKELKQLCKLGLLVFQNGG